MTRTEEKESTRRTCHHHHSSGIRQNKCRNEWKRPPPNSHTGHTNALFFTRLLASRMYTRLTTPRCQHSAPCEYQCRNHAHTSQVLTTTADPTLLQRAALVQCAFRNALRLHAHTSPVLADLRSVVSAALTTCGQPEVTRKSPFYTLSSFPGATSTHAACK